MWVINNVFERDPIPGKFMRSFVSGLLIAGCGECDTKTDTYLFLAEIYFCYWNAC